MTCALADCGKPVHARGLCNAHNHRVLRHGDPTVTRYGVDGVGRRGVIEESCGVSGCEERSAGTGITRHGGRGWCHKHYMTWRRHGHPLGVGRGVKRDDVRMARMEVNRLLDDASLLAELNRRHELLVVIASARRITTLTPAQESVVKALTGATDSRSSLEARKAEVDVLTSQGLTNAAIGRRLGISARTVQRYRE